MMHSGLNRLRIGGCNKKQLSSTKAGNFLTSRVNMKFSKKTLHYGIGQWCNQTSTSSSSCPHHYQLALLPFPIFQWTESHPFFYLLFYFTYYWPLCISHVHVLIHNYIRQREQMHSIITYNLQLKYYNSNMWPSSGHFQEVCICYV